MEFNFEKRVRELAASKGTSLNELEERAGFSRGTLFQIFKHGNPKLHTIAAYAKALGVTVTDFVS